MSRHLCRLLAVGVLFLFLSVGVVAQEEKVANPFYKFWAGTKPGATAVHIERTKLSGPEAKVIPDGVDEKFITHKLISVTDDRAVVEMVVTEQDFLGYVQAAPTRHIFPAKWKKSNLERILLDAGGKTGEDTVAVGGKDIKCKTAAGTIKGPDGEQVEFKLWLSEDVPGTIVKQVRTARQKGDVIAETSTMLQSHNNGD